MLIGTVIRKVDDRAYFLFKDKPAANFKSSAGYV